MDAVLQSFVAGFPVLLAHFATTVAMLTAGVFIYIWLTPHAEFALIKAGNTAAAISLGGAILGLAIPLAICMAASVNWADIVVWGSVTLIIQIAVFRVVDLVLTGLPERIDNGEIGAAIFLFSVKLAIACINAAAVAG